MLGEDIIVSNELGIQRKENKAMKITYLLGAGASCGSLPLANQLGNSMIEAVTKAQKDIERTHGTPGQPYPEEKRPWPRGNYAKNFLVSLGWLAEYTQKHANVDTLARKFWIRQDNEAIQSLHRLKAVLSCYFLYEHSQSHSDMRYDSFFASILDRSKAGIPVFPESISIVTWNYDLLLEKSYHEFCTNEEIVWEHITKNNKIVRLNGRAAAAKPAFSGAQKWPEWSYIDLIYNPNVSHIEHVIELYDNLSQPSGPTRLIPEIYFAWEINNITERIRDAVLDTEILVVIGYSFPFFNQDIDKLVLEQIGPSLNKIYLQTNGDEGGRERLLNLLSDIQISRRVEWKNMIEMISGTDYFYIPNEFSR